MLRRGSSPARTLPVLLLLVACSSGAPVPPSPRGGGLAAAELPDLELRALLLLLVDRQTWEPFTVATARDGGPALRRELALALGRVGDPRALPTLEELAADPAVEVRRAAAFALGQLGEPRAARALGRLVADGDRRAGARAVEALGKLGADLETVFAAGGRLDPGELEARLLPALWRFADADVPRRAERGLGRREPELRLAAAFALSRNPRREALPALRALLGAEEARIRAWAARAVGRVGDASDLGRLLPLLADAEPGPAIRALDAAARLVSTGAAAPADAWRAPLLALLDATHPGVRRAALAAAGPWLLDEALGDRLVMLARASEPWVRRAALLALARGGEPRAAREVFAAAASPEAGDRAAAAAAAGVVGELELARRLLGDRAPRVRQEALAALLAHAGERQAAVAAGLADPDAGVRAATLAWLGDSPLVPVMDLVPALAGERFAGALPELRLNGLRAVAARAAEFSGELEEAVFVLERYAATGPHLLRRAAGEALEALGRSSPPLGAVDTGLTVADYESILRRTWRPRDIELVTEHGAVRLRLACREAPLNCLNLVQLVGQGFYDGLTFHRVVPDFVVQGGDPRGDGWGGPGYTVRDEIGPAGFGRGTVGMALGGPDTGGSQFFITLAPQPHLDGSFTAFGEVVEGHAALERIAPGDRILSAVEVPAR